MRLNFDFYPTFIDSICYMETDYWESKEYSVRQHNYEAILFLTKGTIEYEYQNGSNFTLKKGDLFLLPNNLPYKARHVSPAAYYIVEFCTNNNNQLYETFDAPKITTPVNYELILSKYKKTIRIWDKSTNSSELYVKSLIFRLLCELFNDARDTTKQNTNEIIDYILDNLSNPDFTVQHLCDVFHISASQLQRNIKKETSFTPKKYIIHLRLNKAKKELKNCKKTIQQIAEECGFSNQFYFSRYFTFCYGVTPSQFRKLSTSGF